MSKKLTLPFVAISTLVASGISTGQADDLKGQGIDFGASYELGFQAAPIGSSHGSSFKQRLTLNMAVDMDKLLGVENGSFFVQYQNHNGEHAGGNIFDIQQFDGLDDPEYNRIHMLWYQHKFMDGKLRIKVGKVEPKSEFFAPENARNHLGFSTERSPTIIAQGPPSMSFNAFYAPSDNFEIAFGIYDASWNQGRDENNFKLHNPFKADDFAIFLEGRYKWSEGLNGLPGGLKFGYWRLEGDRYNYDVMDFEHGTGGIYVAYDQTLTNNGIGVYAQFGTADKDISALSRHIGAGLQWKGPFSNRENDVFGAGISTVKFSDQPLMGFSKSSETAYEVFYKAPITENVTMQMDVQAITNPGGRWAEDVIVTAFRMTLAF